MYKLLDSDESAINMLSRQEFYSLKGSQFREDKTDEKSRELLASEKGRISPAVQSHSPQLFGKRIFGISTAGRTILYAHGTGTGKCHGRDTEIMMADYTTKMVQDVIVGDHVMGDDEKPRRVLALSTGHAELFEICCGLESFTCTANHILCFFDLSRGPHFEITEMSLETYMACEVERQNELVLFKQFPRFYADMSLRERRDMIAGLGVHSQQTKDFMVGGRDSAAKLVKLAQSVGCMATSYLLGDTWHVRMREFGGLIINVKSLGVAPFFGFEVNGNHRYLLGNFLVTHNSYTGLGVSANFTDAYELIYKATIDRQPEGSINHTWVNRNTPSVFVIGWEATSRAFMRDLLKYPEFGFITPDEVAELRKRELAATSGVPEHIKFARDYKNMLKHRVQTKSKGGFYQFYGYIEFVNKLFSGKPLIEVEREVLAKIKAGEHITLEQAVSDHIRSGAIKVNMEFVNQFRGSLLIVDEFHNLYNSVIKNNRGVAIYYLMSVVPDLYMVGLTATPANSPTEVLEYLSLLRITPLNKEDFFVGRRLLPGALEKIEKLGRGYISFLQDTNLKYFPSQITCGETIVLEPGPKDDIQAGPVPYLKFVTCPMSQLHQEVYEAYITEKNGHDMGSVNGVSNTQSNHNNHSTSSPDTDADITGDIDDVAENLAGRVAIPVDGLTIYDMVFPGGHFRSRETRLAISALSSAEKDSLKIDIKKVGNAQTYTGDFLRADNLGKYSAKYAKMWAIIRDGIVATKGNPKESKKTLIYHNAVRMSGVLLIQEMLCTNGFVYWTESPNKNTICFHCGYKQADHPGGNGSTHGSTHGSAHDPDFTTLGNLPADVAKHTFVPARLVNIHSEVDKITMDAMLTSYSSSANLYGEVAGIMIGSKKIKEGFEIPHTRRLIVSSFPTNISILLQIYGRVSRKGSHLLLDADKRDIEIHILVSTVNLALPHTGTIAPEVYRYAEKLQDYKVIQQIEKVQNENAVDAPILYDINMSTELRERSKTDTLGNLFFEPKLKMPEIERPSTLTYYGYKWAEDDIKIVIYCIKRLFLMCPAWTYNALWETVRNPPFSLEVNPKLFPENIFIIALSYLSEGARDVAMWKSYGVSEQLMVTNKDIICGGVLSRIVKVGDYYGLFPVSVETISRGIGPKTTNARVSIDAETFLRPIDNQEGHRVNIQKYLLLGELDHLYIEQKNKIWQEYVAGTWKVNTFLLAYPKDFQVRIIEDAISGLLTDPADYTEWYKMILDYMGSFAVTIRKGEVWKYKDVVKQFGQEMADIDPEACIAYCTATSVRIYDVAASKWVDVNKVALNKQIPYTENPICVGYLEPKGDRIIFKTREPFKAANKDTTRDKRLIAQGAACDTRSKEDLWAIAAKLGVSISKMPEQMRAIKLVCAAIRDVLMSREQHEREKKSLVKYLYGWWD